ncbi:MAG: hypothetical protein ABJL67_09310 [Sulfitobacter sp.]
MTEKNTGYTKFESIGEFLGVTPNKLFSDWKTFNSELPKSEAVSVKTLNKAKTIGVSFRNTSSRKLFLAFLEKNFQNDEGLTERFKDEFFDAVDESKAGSAAPFDDKVFLSNPEVFESIGKMLAIRGTDNDLTENLNDYADYYYLVRKTTRDADLPYYEEPFRIRAHGENSYLIPRAQGLNTGFSFASMGICTTILFHRHKTRVLGARVIMLYGNDDPLKAGITGVMLRFSDDTARPVASQVLARRINDKELADKWDGAVKKHQVAENEGPAFRVSNSELEELHLLTNTVDEKNDPNALLEIYRAFALAHHAKAFDGQQWDAAAASLSLEGSELAGRLLQKPPRSHPSDEE